MEGNNLTTKYGGNSTLLRNPSLCTLDTCDLSLASMEYIPSLGANAFFAGLFALFIVVQIVQGIRYKTWGYMVAMFLGLLGEAIGYLGRVMIHNSPFSNDAFLTYLVCLTISPALLSAGIYLCLSRIIVVYGENLSRFKPRTYTIVFCSCDFLSLLLQAFGGAIASLTTNPDTLKLGINIMIAGVSIQVASLIAFALAAGDFFYRAYKNPNNWSLEHSSLYFTTLFKYFLYGLTLATFTIFIRSVYRCAELSAGFSGPLANDQISFMILEPAMIAIATFCLTFLHPGMCFQGAWRSANFKFRAGKKNVAGESSTDLEMSGKSGVVIVGKQLSLGHGGSSEGVSYDGHSSRGGR